MHCCSEVNKLVKRSRVAIDVFEYSRSKPCFKEKMQGVISVTEQKEIWIKVKSIFYMHKSSTIEKVPSAASKDMTTASAIIESCRELISDPQES
mmetsp:Transcript_9116/g.11233  ORF Transcript_9116/g.11233 Transcript_9116/m.11233 type:complete len:94 (+) Transcript_9116:799-1080(+)